MICCVLLLTDEIWQVKFYFFGKDRKFQMCPYYMHLYLYVILTQGVHFIYSAWIVLCRPKHCYYETDNRNNLL